MSRRRPRLENGQQAPGAAERLLVTVVLTACCLAVAVPFLGIVSTSVSSAAHVNGAGGFVVVVLFSPGLIPVYLTVKQAGLLNSWWSLVLPGLVSAFNIIVLRSFFMNIPAELFESARIDGASDWHVFTRLVLPLSKAVLAVIGLFYAVGYWNAFFGALIYLSDQGKWPLTLILRTYLVDNQQLSTADLGAGAEALTAQPALQMAMLLIAVAPILVVYPFLQKHFTTGMLTGAVKG